MEGGREGRGERWREGGRDRGRKGWTEMIKFVPIAWRTRSPKSHIKSEFS